MNVLKNILGTHWRCEICDGRGKILVKNKEGIPIKIVICPNCNGKGYK